MNTPIPDRARIEAIHKWYCENVLPMRLTPEVERLWFEWFKAGYTGPDLRDVIRYIRRQILQGKRNEGALKLTNLIARGECGFIGFDQDLGLARARSNLSVEKKLSPVPGAPPPPHPQAATEPAEKTSRAPEVRSMIENIAKLKKATE